MKPTLRPGLVLLAVALILPACSTPTEPHRITLRTGGVIESSTRPKLDERTGYLRFHDLDNKDLLLRPDEVTSIERL